jgi:hypothetical protein
VTGRSAARTTLLLVPLLLILASQAQTSSQVVQEQSSFGTEEAPGEPRVSRPHPVPDAVLRILETDEGVRSCLKDNPLSAGQHLGSWFLASEIHLDSPAQTDLIVVPSFQGEEGMCFESVEGIGWFWVFRSADTNYQLVLKAAGNGLEVLRTRSNGYRDIQTGVVSQAGKYVTTVTFRFNGNEYVKHEETTQEQ